MRIRAALTLGSLLALLPISGRADVVYLSNGRSFDGVLAEETDSQVQIQMPGGELRIPKSQVLRVEKGESSFAEYLTRKESVRRSIRGADWLGLALWAQARGLQHGVREAALKAAELEPRLADLAPVMRSFGFVLDEELERWIPYADAMRRRGFVQVSGQWLSREELAEHQRQRDDEAQRRALRDATEAAAAASRAQRVLAELTLYREVQRENEPPSPEPYSWPLAVWPGYVLSPGFGIDRPHHHRPNDPGRPDGDHHRPPQRAPREDRGYNQLLGRQPGSLLPLAPAPRPSRSGRSGR